MVGVNLRIWTWEVNALSEVSLALCYIFACIGVLPACVYVYYMCAWSMRGLDPLALDSWMIVRHHVGTGNQIWILSKNKGS